MAVPKIIILSDGTGNAASSVWRTNVWRMFQALDLKGNYQAAKYDDGVGTSSFSSSGHPRRRFRLRPQEEYP
ncbi:MAG: DUF2235 domain-containing protein [Afipia sp.]|nr:DUF2235 domain-containing protein [Afipia sp.]